MRGWLIGVKVRRLVTATAALLVIGAGVAYATIPDSAGVYPACELTTTGTIRLIDPSLASATLLGHCTELEIEITWNEQGQP